MFKRSVGSQPGPQTKPSAARPVSAASVVRPLPPGQQAYEARRAAKAGVSLERWMADKQKRVQAEQEAERRARARDRLKEQSGKPGLLKRLLDRAHKPL